MKADELAGKYHGDMAGTYDELREGTTQWANENAIVEGLLSRLPPGTSVLDVPVGTGRFLSTYAARDFKVTGVDVSSAMLAKARRKAQQIALDAYLSEGSAYALEFRDDAFDAVVSIRFLDWVEPQHLGAILSELTRVCRRDLIVYVPTFTPISELLRHPGGLVRLLRQLKLRAYRRRVRSDAVVHNRTALLTLFKRLGLITIEKVCIDRADAPLWQRGVDRDIYLLSKPSDA